MTTPFIAVTACYNIRGNIQIPARQCRDHGVYSSHCMLKQPRQYPNSRETVSSKRTRTTREASYLPWRELWKFIRSTRSDVIMVVRITVVSAMPLKIRTNKKKKIEHNNSDQVVLSVQPPLPPHTPPPPPSHQ